ncbi:MAG: ATP-binding protein [bacterium]|nr:ATP-binding protein [bacterium]
MEDLSLHILDISENSIAAGASEIKISINEDTKANTLLLEIKDNGGGLDEEMREKVLDPFYTSKEDKPVGLGLPFLAQAAREAEGGLDIQSEKGKGTLVSARFLHDHIDRKPMGNILETLMTLITAKGTEIDIIYEHRKNGAAFSFDTREVKGELQDVPITNPEVLHFLRETISDGLTDLK